MSNYKSLPTPDSLEESLEIIQVMQEFLQRKTIPPPPAKKLFDTGLDDQQVQLLQSKVGQIVDMPIPKADDLLVITGAAIPQNDLFQLRGDFVPTKSTDSLLLISDGRRLHEVVRAGGVGQTFGCPVTITGDCINALDVINGSAVRDFRVSTEVGKRYVNVGASTQLIVGSTNPGPDTYPSLGFMFAHQGGFAITEQFSGTYPFFMEAQGQVVFSDVDAVFPALPSIAGLANAVTFKGPTAFVGGFAWDRQTVSADGGFTQLDTAGKVTYVGYTGVGPHVIRLPPTTTLATVAGSKPGAIIIIKDETNLASSNAVNVDGFTSLIDGQVNVISLFERASTFLITDGTNWFEFA